MKQGGIRALMALALLLGVLAAKDGGAADWSVVPSVSLRGEFNSNLNYSFENKISDILFTLTPAADFNYATEILQLQGHVGWAGLVYAKSGSADHIDQNYFINAKYGVTPRLNLNMKAAFIVDSSLQQELITSGFVMTRTPRQSYVLGPGLTYAITERLSATAGYQLNPVHYQDPNFRNYTTQQVNFALSQLLKNEKTTLSLNLSCVETTYTNNDLNRVLQLSLGVSHKFSEVWLINFQGGASYSFVDFTTQVQNAAQAPFFVLVQQPRLKQTFLSPYFSLSAVRRWDKASLTAGYIRNQSASGAGSVNDTNGLNLAIGYEFTERLKGTVVGSYNRGSAVSQRNSFINSVYQAGPQLSYQVTEKLSFSPGYTFSLRQDSPPVRTTNNHLTWLMLTYSYPIHYQK
jgi:hypothetical protein